MMNQGDRTEPNAEPKTEPMKLVEHDGSSSALVDPGSPVVLPPAPRPRRTRTRRIAWRVALVCGGLLALAPLIFWSLYRHDHVVSRDALVKGHIASVGPQVSGVVTEVMVQTGDDVRRGQVIARLADRELRAQVERQRSEVQKATRQLEVERRAIVHERRRLNGWLAESSARLAAVRAQVDAAQSRAEEAAEKHTVWSSLAERQVLPQEQAREAAADRRTAEALLAAAQADQEAAAAARRTAQIELDGLDVREDRIRVLESELAALRAQLAVAEAELEASVIRAPTDGSVARRLVEPGASVQVGQSILSLRSDAELWVEAWIDENDLAEVAVGSEAVVRLKAYPEEIFTGVVETIGVSTDYELPTSEVPQPRHLRMRGTPLVAIRIGLDQGDERLLPGLSADVGIRKIDR